MKVVIERLLKQSQEQQKSTLRYFSRYSPEVCIQILENKIPIFHKLRQENGDVDKGVLEYCALILAIQAQKDEDHSFSKKAFTNSDLDVIRKISKNKAHAFVRSITKPDPKREKLLGYWAIVRTLKVEQNFSFRQITLYLKKYHRFEVVHSTICKLWNELEVTNNTKDVK